jgi:hypothetical protein
MVVGQSKPAVSAKTSLAQKIKIIAPKSTHSIFLFFIFILLIHYCQLVSCQKPVVILRNNRT